MSSQPPATLDAEAHRAQLRDHAAWAETGRALLDVADLIWPTLQRGFEELHARLAALRRAFDAGQVIGERAGDGGMLFLPGAVPVDLEPMPLVRHMAFTGAGNTFLLNAGYAVENLLKAVRVKRLVMQGKTIAFGCGPDRIPRTHRYEELARVELGALSEQEIQLLRRLALYVTWAGRYPVKHEPPPIDEVNGRAFYTWDHERVHALCQRIIDKYESLS